MKENYYERLGVEETADAQQIKRAYYTQVKKYPPEKFPEEYKALRAAYDILSDAKRRAEYDQVRSLPEDAAYLFEQAEKLKRLGRDAQAAEVYEKILRLHPGLHKAYEALARSFEDQRKNGKAISLWEKLCENEPDNAEYAHELALSYDHRGWVKKADAQYRRALEMDGGNADCWVALLNCHVDKKDWDEARTICQQGIQAMREHNGNSIRLYAFAVMFSARDDTAAAEQYLSEIVRVMRTGGGQGEHPIQTVRFLLEVARTHHKPEFVKYIREMAAMLPRIDEDIKQELAEASRVEEIEALEERGFSVLFHDLFATLIDECDCEDCRNDITAMECNILMEPNVFRPQLLRLQKEYTHLYEMHADFFNEALRARDTEKFLYRRLKQLSKKGLAPAGLQAYGEASSDTPQTVRRESPKVGRNDPCPCGSGKKYKKCCGR